MKKKIIAISVVLIVVLVAVTALLFSTPKYEYMVEFEKDFVVENGVAPEAAEYVIVLSDDDGYIMHGDWTVEPMGMVIGFDIADESGNVIRWFVAGGIDWNTDVIELPAGKYTMTLTPITGVEQWREYCAQFDTSDWVIPVEESEPGMEFTDGAFHFDFCFRLEKTGSMLGFVCVIGAVIGVIFFVIVFAIAQKDDSMKQNYDERQEVLRGRGAKYGLYTMFFLNLALFLVESAGVSLPVSPGMALMISVIVGGIVFAVYCVWKEAYFALNQKAGVYIVVFLVLAGYNLVIGIAAFLDGAAVQNNQLTLRSLNLFAGIMMLVICGALILKKVCKDREEE